ncbi:hypothetical protein G7Z17_g4357 [Cylindrodendrum hubeiense]|uniref:Heterokaryon incompatibility domain-containing protein n=1 Tax=Cylindrodendrum hubeiense TaxID=595255 RepID=A0A9P5HAV8_9HYPO|nr:hypothetical protein G7Z17_g4357 [Cylindrodendrum hubeiense]
MARDQSQCETNQDQRTESGPGQHPSPYRPLNQDIDSMRLMRIKSAKSDDDPIICTLNEIIFQDKPKFDALSYAWGDSPTQCSIFLNNVSFSVKQNLKDALCYLRRHAPDTLYWIDALCINQDDIPERNKQVRIMHHIYSRATTVVVWLGKRYAEYEVRLPDLHKLGHFKPPSEQPKLESPPDRPQSGPSGGGVHGEDPQQRIMAEDLYNDDYWNRLWIIQEIGLARGIKVCFGNSAVNWALFVHFITMHGIGKHGPIRLDWQRKERYAGSSTLLQLLHDHRDAQCQDNKDKVYGLVGLASDARGLVIDYNKSVIEIWTDVMEFLNRDGLFAGKDIVQIGDLVKSLLMDNKSGPLQQILRPYAPGKDDRMVIGGLKTPKVFKLEAAILGLVKHVGPRPEEIVGCLRKVDEWTEQVQANYQRELGRAHMESDILHQAKYDLEISFVGSNGRKEL